MNEQGRTQATSSTPTSAWTMTLRGLWLLCPKCGQGRIFRGWFTMNDRCPACGRLFNRAPGYLLGSIYFNYGVTAILGIVAYLGLCLYYGKLVTSRNSLAALCVLTIVFALWFFRYARSLWIAFDERWDPWPNEEERRREGD